MPRWLRWTLHLLVAAVAVALVAREVAHNWQQFHAAPVTLAVRPGWLLLSVLSVGVVSALQIESWRRILAGWAQSLSLGAAARIWFLANLGRYVPGKVWSVAGMLVLAEREGVQRWAAAASAVAVQALGLGTAVAVIAATTPSLLGSSSGGALSPLTLAVAALAAAGTMAFLAWNRGVRAASRVAGVATEWRALPARAVLVSAALTLASWLVYGLAFWLLALGLGLPASRLPLPTAAGVFALGYTVGLLALPAPGGIGFRESVFVALLTPALGLGSALALAAASRIQLTAIEGAAGLGALMMANRNRGKSRDTRPH